MFDIVNIFLHHALIWLDASKNNWFNESEKNSLIIAKSAQKRDTRQDINGS